MPAALAAEAAHRQGKFWEMHDKLFANSRALTPENFDKYAQEIGLNMARFKADMASPSVKQTVENESKQGTAIGARGTPAFFINGRRLSGAQPFESFKTVIDQEIVKANELIKKGVPLSKVYDELLKDAAASVPAPQPRSDLAPGAPGRKGG